MPRRRLSIARDAREVNLAGQRLRTNIAPLSPQQEVNMSIKWIAVVNRIEGKIFSEKSFQLLAHLKNELGRAKNRELTDGKPGQAGGKFAGSSGVHNLTGEKNPHEEAAVQFAKRMTRFFEEQLNLHRFDDLLLIAEPKMLGRLKIEMNTPLANRTKCLAKDLGKVNPVDLKKIISEADTAGRVRPLNWRKTERASHSDPPTAQRHL
jgi:protein required for attachment to host cells